MSDQILITNCPQFLEYCPLKDLLSLRLVSTNLKYLVDHFMIKKMVDIVNPLSMDTLFLPIMHMSTYKNIVSFSNTYCCFNLLLAAKETLKYCEEKACFYYVEKTASDITIKIPGIILTSCDEFNRRIKELCIQIIRHIVLGDPCDKFHKFMQLGKYTHLQTISKIFTIEELSTLINSKCLEKRCFKYGLSPVSMAISHGCPKNFLQNLMKQNHM